VREAASYLNLKVVAQYGSQPIASMSPFGLTTIVPSPLTSGVSGYTQVPRRPRSSV
jgi:hypothetical protein